MRWSSALSCTLTLALMVKSLPSGINQEVFMVDDFDPSIPEAGEIVFEPLHFDADGFDISEDGEMDAAILADWKTEVVKQHNAYRAQYGAPALTWSDALYPGTQQWANQCKFQHSNGQGKYGENLVCLSNTIGSFSALILRFAGCWHWR